MTSPAGRARAGQTLAGAAVLITVVTLASRVVGFGRWLAQGHFLGTGGVDQPFNMANQLPNMLFEVAAGGALAGAVVPLLSGYLTRAGGAGSPQEEAEARAAASRTASALLGWTLVVLVPLGALVALLAGPVIDVLPLDDPDDVAVATSFLRVFALQVPLYGLAVVLGGVLQSHKRFFWPAFAPLVSSVVVIVVYAVFGALADGNQRDVAALSQSALVWLAWGMTAGVAFLVVPLLLPVHRTGIRLRPTLRFRPGDGSRAARLAFAGVGALVAQQLALLVVMLVSHPLGGDTTWTVFLYVQQVYLLPFAVLAFPIATSAFPRFAEHGAARRLGPLGDLVASTTRTLLLVLGAGVAALLAAAPLVENVFDLVVTGGDAPGMAAGLTWMAPGLVGYALILHLSRALYSVDRGRAAVVATASGWGVAAALTALLPVLLPAIVGSPAGQQVTPQQALAGIGAANTAGMLVAGLGLLLAVRRHVGDRAVVGVPRTLALLAAGVAAGAVAGRLLVPAPDRTVPGEPEVPLDAGALAADVGLGLLAGLVAAVVVLVVGVLADPRLRSRAGGLARRLRPGATRRG
ncbi:lipid II flippase MurJ [Isoptericola hypogeus]|uniref:Lipid II flippase MurJ n=1 Tax=Isoptericola hypogeus TaxID=300179 RepID=A0ABN2JWN9_9MICO